MEDRIETYTFGNVHVVGVRMLLLRRFQMSKERVSEVYTRRAVNKCVSVLLTDVARWHAEPWSVCSQINLNNFEMAYMRICELYETIRFDMIRMQKANQNFTTSWCCRVIVFFKLLFCLSSEYLWTQLECRIILLTHVSTIELTTKFHTTVLWATTFSRNKTLPEQSFYTQLTALALFCMQISCDWARAS